MIYIFIIYSWGQIFAPVNTPSAHTEQLKDS